MQKEGVMLLRTDVSVLVFTSSLCHHIFPPRVPTDQAADPAGMASSPPWPQVPRPLERLKMPFPSLPCT